MVTPTKTSNFTSSRASTLPTLLSQALVAFTIEFDNEAEHQLPHTTTRFGRTPGAEHAPWLVSLIMWFNCMQHVPEEGVRPAELERLARTPTNLNGMLRWGYLTLAPEPADPRPKPPRSEWLLRATPGGRLAQKTWEPLFATIEERWRSRFGKEIIGKLRKSLLALVEQLDPSLPDCLPILGYGLVSRREERKTSKKTAPRSAPAPAAADLASLPLCALFSRVLLAFACDFEHASPLSLAICANVLRVLHQDGARLRDLPVTAGVSKESIAMALGILRKSHLATLETSSRTKHEKIVRLTVRGAAAQRAYRKLLGDLEERWRARFGDQVIQGLRFALEQVVGDGTPQASPLLRGLEPHPDGWRASVPKPATLPHFPMVLHRGGFPDGS